MNLISFTDIGLPKKFQPDLSNSPLNNDIRTLLSEKIKQMHCQECISKGYKVCIALTEADFSKVSVSDNVLLLSVKGNSYKGIIQDIETSITLKSHPNIIVNFILSDKIKNPKTVSEIYEVFQKHDTITGLCIDTQPTVKYNIDIIAYK